MNKDDDGGLGDGLDEHRFHMEEDRRAYQDQWPGWAKLLVPAIFGAVLGFGAQTLIGQGQNANDHERLASVERNFNDLRRLVDTNTAIRDDHARRLIDLEHGREDNKAAIAGLSSRLAVVESGINDNRQKLDAIWNILQHHIEATEGPRHGGGGP